MLASQQERKTEMITLKLDDDAAIALSNALSSELTRILSRKNREAVELPTQNSCLLRAREEKTLVVRPRFIDLVSETVRRKSQGTCFQRALLLRKPGLIPQRFRACLIQRILKAVV